MTDGAGSPGPIQRKVIEGEAVAVSASEYSDLPNRHKHLVSLVYEGRPSGTVAMKPVTDPYDAPAPPRLVKLGYVEITEPEGDSQTRAYSRDELIEELQNVAEIVGRAPTFNDIKEHGETSTSPYLRVFGGIKEALEAADLYPTYDPE